MLRRRVSIVIVLASLGGLARAAIAQPAAAETPARDDCTLQAGPTHTVVRIIDSQTMEVDDGTEIRLVGALAPSPPAFLSSGAVWPPNAVARAALASLVLGRRVELAFSGRRQDRWGRTLAHVFLVGTGQREWVQGHMLQRGHARAYVVPDSLACLPEMRAHEKLAADAGIGLWRNAAYRVREAADAKGLMRLRNTYQLVEGRLHKVASTKSRLYLNFGEDWRSDFTAGFAAKARTFGPEAIARITALEGRRVRIRGWIERRNGPYVELLHPGQVEAIGEAPPPGPGIARGGPPASAGDGSPAGHAAPDADAPEPGAPELDVPGPDAPEPGDGATNEERPERSAPGALDL